MPRPTATLAIAAVTVVVSLAISFLRLEDWASIFAGFIPARASGTLDIYDALPVWITPLSATLVHGGLLHLGFNTLMLVYAGSQTEKAVGAGGIVVLYLVGAFAAAGAQWMAGPLEQVRMIGASGAISALMGAYSLLYGRNSRARAIGPIPATAVHVIWLAAAWTGINLLVGLLSRGAGMPIAAAAHIGGFIAGLALARPLLMMRWRGA